MKIILSLFTLIKKNWVISLCVLGFLWFFTPLGGMVRGWLARLQASQSTNEYQGSKIYVQVQPKQTYNLQQVADQVYKAFHQTGLFNMSEDEEAAIDAIKSVPQVYVSAVADLYAKKGVNMYDDFMKYLSKNDYLRVEAWLQ